MRRDPITQVVVPGEDIPECGSELTEYLAIEWRIITARRAVEEAEQYARDIINTYEQEILHAEEQREELLQLLLGKCATAVSGRWVSHWIEFANRILSEVSSDVWEEEQNIVFRSRLWRDMDFLREVDEKVCDAFRTAKAGADCYDLIFSELEKHVSLERTLFKNIRKTYKHWWEFITVDCLLRFSEEHTEGHERVLLYLKKEVCAMRLRNCDRKARKIAGIESQYLSLGPICKRVLDEFNILLASIQEILSTNRDDHGYCDPERKLAQLWRAMYDFKAKITIPTDEWVATILSDALREGRKSWYELIKEEEGRRGLSTIGPKAGELSEEEYEVRGTLKFLLE